MRQRLEASWRSFCGAHRDPVLLHLELQEGAEAHALQPYYDEFGHTSAVLLRLLEPWFRGP